jgi:hypothetical protein
MKYQVYQRVDIETTHGNIAECLIQWHTWSAASPGVLSLLSHLTISFSWQRHSSTLLLASTLSHFDNSNSNCTNSYYLLSQFMFIFESYFEY